MPSTPKRYRTLTGINCPDKDGKDQRHEPGVVLTSKELAAADVAWLLKVGAIEEVRS